MINASHTRSGHRAHSNVMKSSRCGRQTINSFFVDFISIAVRDSTAASYSAPVFNHLITVDGRSSSLPLSTTVFVSSAGLCSMRLEEVVAFLFDLCVCLIRLCRQRENVFIWRLLVFVAGRRRTVNRKRVAEQIFVFSILLLFVCAGGLCHCVRAQIVRKHSN